MGVLPLHEEEWEYVQTLLPSDLEESDRGAGALLRCRNVPDAGTLLWMALAYGVSDLSLKDVAACASGLSQSFRNRLTLASSDKLCDGVIGCPN
jgi:hypothetical protein